MVYCQFNFVIIIAVLLYCHKESPLLWFWCIQCSTWLWVFKHQLRTHRSRISYYEVSVSSFIVGLTCSSTKHGSAADRHILSDNLWFLGVLQCGVFTCSVVHWLTPLCLIPHNSNTHGSPKKRNMPQERRASLLQPWRTINQCKHTYSSDTEKYKINCAVFWVHCVVLNNHTPTARRIIMESALQTSPSNLLLCFLSKSCLDKSTYTDGSQRRYTGANQSPSHSPAIIHRDQFTLLPLNSASIHIWIWDAASMSPTPV